MPENTYQAEMLKAEDDLSIALAANTVLKHHYENDTEGEFTSLNAIKKTAQGLDVYLERGGEGPKNIQIMFQSAYFGWRSRQPEINRLKARIRELEDKMTDPGGVLPHKGTFPWNN